MRKQMEDWENEDAPTNTATRLSSKKLNLATVLVGALILIILIWAAWFLYHKKAGNSKKEGRDESNNKSTQISASSDIAINGTKAISLDSGSKKENPIPSFSNQNAIELADRFYKDPFKNSRGNAKENVADSVKSLLHAGQFNEAVQKMERGMTANASISDKEVMAHAYFRNRQWDKAALYFKVIASSGQPPQAKRSEWYLTLSLLAQGPGFKPEFQKKLSEILSDKNHPNFNEAQKLHLSMNKN